jgi:hypothetical protein
LILFEGAYYHPRVGTMTKEIRLTAPHPLFRPRVDGGTRRLGHPGTAVRIGEELYEIAAAEHSGGDWVYRLEPWTGHDAIRAYVEWGEAAEREFAASLRADRSREQKNFLIWVAQVFLGFLPAEAQERLSQTRGMDPARATFWSAALETLIAFPFAFLFFIDMFAAGAGGGGKGIPGWAGGLAFVTLADGIFRLVAAVSSGEPMGSLFLALLRLRARPEGPRYAGGDEILEIGDALSVLSPVRKAWWERAGGMTFKGKPYSLADAGREKKKYAYRFHEGGDGFPPLDPELEELRNRSSDHSYIFAILWGFLPESRQKALEFYGRYRPRPYVLVSIGVNILLALAMSGPGLKGLAGGVLEPGSLILFAGALALFVECALRLLRLLKDGRPSGSCLGLFVMPLYDRAFRDGPVPPS